MTNIHFSVKTAQIGSLSSPQMTLTILHGLGMHDTKTARIVECEAEKGERPVSLGGEAIAVQLSTPAESESFRTRPEPDLSLSVGTAPVSARFRHPDYAFINTDMQYIRPSRRTRGVIREGGWRWTT